MPEFVVDREAGRHHRTVEAYVASKKGNDVTDAGDVTLSNPRKVVLYEAVPDVWYEDQAERHNENNDGHAADPHNRTIYQPVDRAS
jgi:hypothetical protein